MDLSKWLFQTGGLLIQVAFITGSTVVYVTRYTLQYYSKDFIQKIVSQKHSLQTSQEDCISTVTGQLQT